MTKHDLNSILLALIRDYVNTLKLNNQILSDVHLEFPSQKEFGDLSLNLALKLGKRLNRPAPKLAEEIVAYLNRKVGSTKLKQDISSIRVAGAGFINFFLSDDYFRKVLKDILILADGYGSSNLGRSRRVLVEFVSANPTGPLSVAHARQAAVGDTLCNILKFLGFRIKREYYLNDEGKQIELLGKSIQVRFKELQGEQIEFPEGGYEGEYIRQIARGIFEKKQEPAPRLGSGRGSRKQEFFSEYGVKYILKIIKQELKDFGITFDSWYSQKKLANSGMIKKVLERLRKQDFIYQKDGALWFKSTAFGDDKDRVVVKSEGAYTYLAPDIAYHQNKYQRRFNWLINLWGPDHHGYVSRLQAAVQALGKKADSLSIIIVQLATIFKGGRPLAMSTRKGQYITLRQILQEVGTDASRFFFLMRRTSAHLDFDLELAKKHTPENPVYYVQYAHARVCSIIRNASFKIKPLTADLNLLREAEELNLIKVLWQFPRSLEICYKNIDPYFITAYLQELAEELHRFYDRHRVLSEDRALSQSRLALIMAARTVLRSGLKLLGVSAPESM